MIFAGRSPECLWRWNGLFMETHPEPCKAKSDGANMLPLDLLEGLLTRLVCIRQAVMSLGSKDK
jgi:2-dehydro-3-deoxyphosphooctonate aldolase (KDO 8-P synthase)